MASHPPSAVQPKKAHVIRYAKDQDIKGFYVATDFKQEDVAKYVADTSNSTDLRIGMRAAWNKGLQRRLHIGLPDDLKPKDVPALTGNMDFENWDSDDDTNMQGDAGKILSSNRKSTATLYRTSEGTRVDTNVVGMDAMVLATRSAVKRKEIETHFSTPQIGQINGQMVEFAAPRENDFCAYSLRQNKDGEYERVGSGDTWSTLATSLEEDLSDGEVDEARYRKRRRITNAFRGTHEIKTPTEALAVGAIVADFAKGSGAWDYLKKLEDAPKGTSFATCFAGSSPLYEPAVKNGRQLATQQTARNKSKKVKTK